MSPVIEETAAEFTLHEFRPVGGQFPNTCVECGCFRDSANHTAGIALVPRRKLTLYDTEEQLQALLDTEDLVSQDQAEEFQLALKTALQSNKDKRDGVVKFLAHCDSQVQLAETEIKRLRERAERFDSASTRLRAYVVAVFKLIHAPDEKGKYPKLEGQTCSLGLQRNPASVDITDEDAVPEKYKEVTLTLPAEVVAQIGTELAFSDSAMMAPWIDARGRASVKKTAVGRDLKNDIEVPGARMKDGEYRLVIK